MVAKRSAVSLLMDLEEFQEQHKLNEEATLGEVKTKLMDQVVDEEKQRLLAGRKKTTKTKVVKDADA